VAPRAVPLEKKKQQPHIIAGTITICDPLDTAAGKGHYNTAASHAGKSIKSTLLIRLVTLTYNSWNVQCGYYIAIAVFYRVQPQPTVWRQADRYKVSQFYWVRWMYWANFIKFSTRGVDVSGNAGCHSALPGETTGNC